MKFFISVITVNFIETEYNVSEGEGVITVGITLNRPSPQQFVLRLEITPNTAQGNVLLLLTYKTAAIIERKTSVHWKNFINYRKFSIHSILG